VTVQYFAVNRIEYGMSAHGVRKGALAGRRALVTGASTGIGAAIATAYAAEGAHVAVHARTSDKAEPVLGRIRAAGGDAFSVAADLADRSAIEPMCKAALEGLGGIDIVVNNAGILRDKSFHNMTDDLWSPVIDVHLNGAYHVTSAAWPHMREQNYGRIISTASSRASPRTLSPSTWVMKSPASTPASAAGVSSIGATTLTKPSS